MRVLRICDNHLRAQTLLARNQLAQRCAARICRAQRRECPVQGSAADIIKKAMIDVDAEIRRRGLKSRMIIQVHDELVFNVKADELAEMQALVADKMEHAYSGKVRLEVSSGVGLNWLEAH